MAAFVTAPSEPVVPLELHGQPVLAVAAAYFGDPTIGAGLLRLLQEVPPAIDTLGVLSYTALQQLFDAANVPGRPTYVKSDFLDELDDHAVERLVSYGTRPSSPFNQVVVRRLGVVDPAATAFFHRDATHVLLVASAWTDPAEDSDAHVRWTRDTWAALRPWSSGTYVNHLGDEGLDRIREAYPATTWQRLTALKRRMDPHNVFTLNQNIPPDGPTPV
ncbi:MAG: BBE domain-containing protein [Pseudonocardiaceae bacterium]